MGPTNVICTKSESSAFKKVPGLSAVFTHLPSMASIRAVIKTDSVFTVGLVASSLLYRSLCFLSSAYALALMRPLFFLFMKMMELRTFNLSCLVKSFQWTGLKTC